MTDRLPFRIYLNHMRHRRKRFRRRLGDDRSKLGSDALRHEEQCEQEASQGNESRTTINHQ